MRARLLLFSAVPLFVSALAVGCTDDTPELKKKGTATTDPGSQPLTTFSPKGCGYTIAQTQLESPFEPFEPHADVATPGAEPKFVRRGLGGDVKAGVAGYADPSTSFSVEWQTDPGTRASRIRFGESADALDRTADGFSFLVLPEVSGSGPADGVRFHEAHVCGLTPGRTYWYQVGGGPAGAEVWSPVYSTTTAPAAGSTDAVQIGFSGDSRDALGRNELVVWKAIAARYKAAAVPLVLFSGDMVFSGLFQDMWDRWATATGDAGPSVFFALAPGNHENERQRVFANMLMPGANTKNAERYASFDYGPVHVVMVDDYPGIVSEGSDDSGYREEILAWLDQDLQKADANRAKVPWIVTFHHHPLYSDTTQTERAAERGQVRAAFQPLYDKYKVDLDLVGHDHFYERFKPIKADKDDAAGTTYVVCAAAGAPSYSIKDGNPLSAFTKTYDPDMGEGIYGIATVDPSKFHVTMYAMASAAAGSSPTDDTVLEEFELTKH